MIVLREHGAIYYGASVPGVAGLPASPRLRPLAVDTDVDSTVVASATKETEDATDTAATSSPTGRRDVFAGVHQSVLGQVGFSADTRIYRIGVDRLPGWSIWYGGADAADRLDGTGPLSGSEPERGRGSWQSLDGGGELERSDGGVKPSEESGAAILHCDDAKGLILAVAEIGEAASVAGIRFRVQDADNYWSFDVDANGARMAVVVDGTHHVLRTNGEIAPHSETPALLQVSDDGCQIIAHVDDRVLASEPLRDHRLADATAVGVAVSGSRTLLRNFEAHPRSIETPPPLTLASLPFPAGTESVLTDDFQQAAGDLDGRTVGDSTRRWERTIGRGVIAATGDGIARVQASVAVPNPGRTAYTVAWHHGELADLEVQITPPGTGRGQNEQGRAGLIFFQDDDHFVIINNWLDDAYPGASISLFSCFGSFEEVFRAVWSNVGDRVRWGVEHRLNVAFDGRVIVARVDGETVLYRALTDIHPNATRLDIRRVGLVANWEWGEDTGSILHRFVARA